MISNADHLRYTSNDYIAHSLKPNPYSACASDENYLHRHSRNTAELELFRPYSSDIQGYSLETAVAPTFAPMNYSYSTSGSLQPLSASISLPPISSIDFHAQTVQRSSPEVIQPLPPPPPAAPRVLPPLPYPSPYAVRPAPPPHPSHMAHEYMHARPIYPGIPSPYQPMPGRMALPSTTDPNLIVAPTRHKAKEVKRRTKTGCLTCRKRRIKVSTISLSSTPRMQPCWDVDNASTVLLFPCPQNARAERFGR